MHNGLNLKSIMSCLISCNVSSSSSMKSYRCLGIASWLHNTYCIFLRNFLHNMVPKLWWMHKDLLQCIILDMRLLFHFKIIFCATMDIMAIRMVKEKVNLWNSYRINNLAQLPFNFLFIHGIKQPQGHFKLIHKLI